MISPDLYKKSSCADVVARSNEEALLVPSFPLLTRAIFSIAEPGTVPRNILAKGTSDRSFEASWLPPLEPNGMIYGYRLFYTTDLTRDFSLWRYKPSAYNETKVEGLQKHATYYFQVAAYNVIGQGPLTKLHAVKVALGGKLDCKFLFF